MSFAGVAVLGLAALLFALIRPGGETNAIDPGVLAARRAATPGTHHRDQGALSEGAIQPPPAGAPEPPAGELLANGGHRFTYPIVNWTGLEDWFGNPRLYGLVHGGVDFLFDTAKPAPVGPGCSGTVTAVAQDANYGRNVIVDCGAGWSTLLGFLLDTSATAGERVVTNTAIGHADPSRGYLHFEIRYQGIQRDPNDYLELPPPPNHIDTPTPETPTAEATQAPQMTTPRVIVPGATFTPTVPEPTAAPGETPPPTSTPRPTSTPTRTPAPTATPTSTPTPTPTARSLPTPTRPPALY